MVQLNIGCGYQKYQTFFPFLRCNFKINIYIFFSLLIPTDYIKSSMKLKDFGSKQCTQNRTWRFNTSHVLLSVTKIHYCFVFKITDART